MRPGAESRRRRLRTARRPATAAGAGAAARIALCAAVCAAILCGPARGGSEELLSRARAAAAQDSHAVALSIYDAILAQEPALRDALAPEIAAQRTWAGRYDEALVEFQWFLARHPERDDVRLVRALAESWSGRTREALESYRLVLSSDPTSRDALLGEARMLSWSGELEASRRRYRARIGSDPQDADAWLGLAQAFAWEGEHRRARSICSALIEGRPIGPDWAGPVWAEEGGRDPVPGEGRAPHGGVVPGGAWEVLALACRWSGRDDLALETLASAEKAGRASPATRRLAGDIRRRWRPRAISTLDVARDSDDFASSSVRVEGEVPFRHRGRLRAGIQENRFDRPTSAREEERWLLLGLEGRLSEPWHGSVQVRSQTERPAGADDLPVEVSVGAIWTPTDRLRADLGASRTAIFTYEMKPERVIAAQAGIGATWRIPGWTVVAGACDYTSYSDDNERLQARAGLRWVFRPGRARLEMEAASLYQDARRWTGHGYWCPERNRYHSVRLGLELPLPRGIALTGSFETGPGREARGDWAFHNGYGVGLAGELGPLRIEGRFGHAGPAERLREGYSRDVASVVLAVGM